MMRYLWLPHKLSRFDLFMFEQWKLPSGASIDNTKPETIKSVAVIGAGTMGSGIAICFIRAGFPVLLVEQNDKVRPHHSCWIVLNL